jgi:hypothetical protein
VERRKEKNEQVLFFARAFVLEDAHFERIDHSFFVVRNHFMNVQARALERTENRE